MSRNAYVYMLASKPQGTLYVGVTSDLKRRVYEHRERMHEGFTKEYNVTRLVWFEAHEEIRKAIGREKRLKHWNRAWKISLIEEDNPQWLDLYDSI